MEASAASPPLARNDDYDWDAFDPDAYVAHNYRTLRDDDRRIVEGVRDFFAASGIGSQVSGLDIGPGANLYPTLGMLPFCEKIDLWEFSAANVKWLRDQQDRGFDPAWDSFWQVYAENPIYARYAAVHDLRKEFADKVAIRQESIFALPRQTWDIGAMFFVACSISSDLTEFGTAVHSFIRSLRPGAPFVAAFMAESAGYSVGDQWFPAVAIGHDEVAHALAPVSYDTTINQIDSGNPLRANVGMLLATGYANGR